VPAPFDRLDHAIVAARDLDALAKMWKAFGFTLTPRGLHSGGATANHCIMFRDSYLELLAPTGEGTSALAEGVMAQPDGGLGMAFQTDDAAATSQALRDAGIGTQGPARLTRPLVLDGETHEVAFDNVMFEPVLSGVLAFACRHLTPDLTRARHEWQLHANGATGIAELVIGADNPEDYREPLEALFGADHVASGPHGIAVVLDHFGLAVMTHPGLKARFGFKSVDGLPPLPILAAVSIAVNEPDAAGAMLDMGRVPYADNHTGLVVAAKNAGGIIVEFAEN
jgi:hypothetical protein